MKDIKSILIGAFATICFFLFIGFTGYNQGEITCNSITLIDKDGNIYARIDKSFINNMDMGGEVIKSMNQLLTLGMEDISEFQDDLKIIKNQLEKIENDIINLKTNNNSYTEIYNDSRVTNIQLEQIEYEISDLKNKINSYSNIQNDLEIRKIQLEKMINELVEEVEDDITSFRSQTKRNTRRLNIEMSELKALILAEGVVIIGNKDTEDSKKFQYIARDVEPAPYPGFGVKDFLEYPDLAKEAGIEGKLSIAAFINSKGIPKNIYLVKGLFESLDQVALRAVRLSRWIPAKQQDKRIGVWVIIPVVFRLE